MSGGVTAADGDICAESRPREARQLPRGLAALCAVARFHQCLAEPVALAHRLALPAGGACTRDDLLIAAQSLGLKARWTRWTAAQLHEIPLPAVVCLKAVDGADAHERRVVLARQRGERLLIQDFDGLANEARGGGAETTAASRAGVQTLARDDFLRVWSGDALLVTRRAAMAPRAEGFDFSWFMPSLVKYRRLLGEVLLISLVLQLFALVSPLFFQAVMDKVLVHQGKSTLDALVFGLVVVVVFESVLGLMRTYLFTHTTQRIDVELGARLYRHLLSLPLSYFEARRVGDSVARVRELESLRGFLKGQCLTALLDVVFSLVFVAVMLAYSPLLTLIVLASLPMYASVITWATPVLRRRLDQKFALGAENQAMLVESVTGIQTVKAAALEPQFEQRWDRQLAAYVLAAFRSQMAASTAQESVGLIGKLVQAATLWWGSHLVMQGQLTVGQFVAFNMFAGRVSQPVMRLAQLWMDVQQAGVSMRRLADVLDAKPDMGSAPQRQRATLPRVVGAIAFKDVRFRYRDQARPVLDGLSLEIQAGEVVGIVGRSGSGKSTLTKLVQCLYRPEAGQVLVDGVDIGTVDVAQLRRHIGVVLQDNLLFNASVRDNIAVADPGVGLDEVIRAARLAGAHGFISEWPEGYDTVVSEQGSSLSGGQRQRIAIARALFSQPRILIFDEATSALDYESEAALQRNMAAICRGRTVLIVAHRLSAVRQAHRILVMDQGRLVEAGSHDELVRRPAGLYARLWGLQASAVPTAQAVA